MRGTSEGRDLEEASDNVLSYAEVKALATGNPLVIEQAGVQAELAKLERLARAHRDDQNRLQRKATLAHKDAQRSRDQAAIYQAANLRRLDTSGDRFSLQLGGPSSEHGSQYTTYTKRETAGSALLDKLQESLGALDTSPQRDAELRARTVGRLAGFTVQLEGHKLAGNTEVRLAVVLDHDNETGRIRIPYKPEDLTTKTPDGLIAQLETAIRRLEDRRDRALTDAAKHDDTAADAEARIGQPFPDQDRLDQLRRRNQEIADQLNAEATPEHPSSESPVTSGESEQRRTPSPAVTAPANAAEID